MQNERDELTRDDARFVEALRTHYAPEPLDGPRRTAFDARLRERISRPGWRGALLPGFAAASVAALALWWLPNTAQTPVPAPTPIAENARTPAAILAAGDTDWEQVLFYGDLTRVQQDAESELPPEFAAIDGLFFDDV
jgi:hypothetical protein